MEERERRGGEERDEILAVGRTHLSFFYLFGSVSRQGAAESRDRAPFFSLSLRLLFFSCVLCHRIAVSSNFSPALGAQQSPRTFSFFLFSQKNQVDLLRVR